MSRIGKQPLKIPSGVSVAVEGRQVTVKGPKGQVVIHHPAGVKLEKEGDQYVVARLSNSKGDRAAHGTLQRTLGNCVKGVQEPFVRTLEIVGVGFQFAVKGKALGIKAGYANEVMIDIPEGVTIQTPSTTKAVVSGCDKQKVGQTAARIRAVRPPEPYNGKGVRYDGERIQRKAGKSFASGG